MYPQKEQELVEKLKAAEKSARGAAGIASSGNAGNAIRGMDTAEPQRACLRDRVMMDLDRAQRESRKTYQLAELADLLEKHPDVARILDLVELVRG